MRSTMGRGRTTFERSVVGTVTSGLLQSLHGGPVSGEIIGHGTGAVLSSTLLEGFLSRGFMHPMPSTAQRSWHWAAARTSFR